MRFRYLQFNSRPVENRQSTVDNARSRLEGLDGPGQLRKRSSAPADKERGTLGGLSAETVYFWVATGVYTGQIIPGFRRICVDIVGFGDRGCLVSFKGWGETMQRRKSQKKKMEEVQTTDHWRAARRRGEEATV